MQLTARAIPVSGEPRKDADASGPGTGPAPPLGVRCVSLSFAQWPVVTRTNGPATPGLPNSGGPCRDGAQASSTTTSPHG